ncbi:hypothetical protein SDC9_128795 [bioreactor metagenome]|uniref:Uncharacterized protein n=1 Tax=bioreactor metagenome TaxID=1076179 RepID=A0A645CY33_9ZZZZ
MGNGSGQFDVAHTLAAHLGPGNLHAAAVADLTLITDLLILAAVALPVLGGPKNLFAEQAIPFRLQSTVVDRLRLLDFAVGPLQNLLRRGHADLNGIKSNIVAGSSVNHMVSSYHDSEF